MDLPIIREKNVQQFGHGIGVYLTPEFKNLGIEKGERVFVTEFEDRIVISKDIDNLIKPAGIDEHIWHSFLIVIQMKKKDGSINHADLIYALNDALKLWIEEQRTVLKIEIPILKKVLPKDLSISKDKNNGE